jgi:hypothetical protein
LGIRAVKNSRVMRAASSPASAMTGGSAIETPAAACTRAARAAEGAGAGGGSLTGGSVGLAVFLREITSFIGSKMRENYAWVASLSAAGIPYCASIGAPAAATATPRCCCCRLRRP